MAASPTGRWVLQVPFITEPGFVLQEPRTVTLASFSADFRPTASGYTNIIIGGLDSITAARDLFKSLRIGAFTASLNSGWGIRVRDEVMTLDMDTAFPNQVDVPLIYPEGKNLRRLTISAGPIQMQVDKVWPRLIDGINFGLTADPASIAMEDVRFELALNLYVGSYFELSHSARFLGLVGVLEVLKDKRCSSQAAQQLVSKWKAEAKQLPDDEEAKSACSRLDWLKSISIGAGVSSLVRRHLGEDRAREAKALYTMRSGLVHDGKSLADAPSTVRQAERLVTDLLVHIIQSGSIDGNPQS